MSCSSCEAARQARAAKLKAAQAAGKKDAGKTQQNMHRPGGENGK